MLIVVEHFDTFHHYFLISVYPPLYLTLTRKQSSEEESEVENIVTAPKTDMFRFRINPEIRKQVEEVYAKNGLTFTKIKTNSLHRRRFKICLAINKEDAPGSAEIAPQ